MSGDIANGISPHADAQGETEYTYVAAAIIIELPPVDGSTQGHSQLFKNGFA